MSALLAAAPALPLHSAGKYVAAAYVMFVAILLIYVAIMARRLRTMERELGELQAALDARDRPAVQPDEPELTAGPR
jgi:flagellar biosynthesis/type III secretory pathway M-ring protein FliF/YscJ